MDKRKIRSEQIEFDEGMNWWSAKKEILTGTIGFRDTELRGEPVMIIDGVELSWNEFAQVVSTNEGFKFKLEFIDPSDS